MGIDDAPTADRNARARAAEDAEVGSVTKEARVARELVDGEARALVAVLEYSLVELERPATSYHQQ